MAWKNWIGGDKLLAAEVMRLAKEVGDNLTFTYDSAGQVATIVDNDTTPATTYTFTWSNGLVTSITDGTNTWTITYNTSNQVTAVSKTP